MEKYLGETSTLILSIGIIVLLLILIVVNFRMFRHVSDLERKYRLFMKGTDGYSVEKALSSRVRDIDKLLADNEKNRADLNSVMKVDHNSLKKYGIVKYDAFEDVGGKMSFALAMLDESNTGFVLNSVHSKDDCFVYLKEVVKGESYTMLSTEEKQALQKAAEFSSSDEE
ncbi:MAG: DUF4446 family protein [Eubacterium sp.]|nr:DUF4446 family protein [Eubacterium sp.]